jgi:hypothetical protein
MLRHLAVAMLLDISCGFVAPTMAPTRGPWKVSMNFDSEATRDSSPMVGSGGSAADAVAGTCLTSTLTLTCVERSLLPTALTRRPPPARIHGHVADWQPAMLSKIVDTLNLVPKDDPKDLGFDVFTMAGASGTIHAYEGPGAPNVAWCSGLQMKGADVARGSITAFCGPLTDVPHLVAMCGVSDGGIDVYIDFRPRADGAYDPACASLDDYPAPETREAFAEGGNRKDFAAAFFTAEAEAAAAALLGLPGASAAPISKEQVATISGGPLLVDVRLPLDDASAAAAASACTAACERWLEWMVSAEDNGRGLPAGMRQTATYTRDTKVRQQHFGFLLSKYTPLFGADEGKALTAADAGPLDEAYVGGGS